MDLSHPVYRSPGQRLARALHRLKARYRAKERTRVECLSTLFPPGAVVLDVGAHFGYFAKEFCRVHEGSCRVHCFEPLAYNYAILEDVMRGYPNARVHRLALAEHEGNAEIRVPIKKSGKIGPGLAHLGPEETREHLSERVAVTTLDAWFDTARLSRLDFVKCDVEGAELPVLRGGKGVIERHRPGFFLEVAGHFTRRMGYEPERLFEFFHRRGYRAYSMDFAACALRPVDGHRGTGDYVFRCPAPEGAPQCR